MRDNPRSHPMAIRREMKVGAFVLAGLVCVAVVIFMIGEERRIFGAKETYFSVFNDVQGLRRGSPVRMGGVDIGTVAEVAYGEDPKDAKIYVRMSIVDGEARRIRKNSVATIEGKGLLGDKMVVVSVGAPAEPEVVSGGQIPSKPNEDMALLMARLGTVSAQVERVMGNLERTTVSLADEKLHDDLKAGVGSLSRILGSVERREGYIGRLFNDPAEADRVSRTMANLERVSSELDLTTKNVNRILAQVHTGPGLAHELVYGEDGSRVAGQVGRAAEELGTTLKGIREGSGLARGLLFGDGRSDKWVADINEASGDLKQIVADLRAGRGTLGALLVDPSVYEDLKLVLGNVERNKALRALVRYSIKKDDKPPKVHDPDAGTASSRGSATTPLGSASVSTSFGGETKAAESGGD